MELEESTNHVESSTTFNILRPGMIDDARSTCDDADGQTLSCSYEELHPSAFKSLHQCPFLMFSTIVVSGGGILFGFDTAALNGILVMPSFVNTMSRDGINSSGWANLSSWITSSLLLGAAISSPFAAVLADKFGRKFCVNMSSCIIFFGACIQASAQRWEIMVFGRLVVGAGVGMLSAVVPVYLAEVSPKSIRGAVSSLFEVTVATGILVAFMVTWAFNTWRSPAHELSSWRLILGIQAALALTLFVLMLPLPESPKWLLNAGRTAQAKAVLRSLRKIYVVGRTENPSGGYMDLTNIDVEYDEMCADSGTADGVAVPWYDFRELLHPSMLLRTSIGVNIKLLQQLTGINSIMYYSSTIFSSIGIRPDTTTAITGLVNVTATFISVMLIERCGRRALLVWGSAGMCASLLVVGMIVITCDPSAPGAAYSIAVFICFFIINFAYSYGPIAWLYPAEIFPMRVRAKGVSVSTSADWLGNFSVSKLVPLMILPGSAAGGLGGTFLIFAAWTFLMIVWGLSHVHETAHLSPENIQEVFSVATWTEYYTFLKVNLSYSLYYGNMSMFEFTRSQQRRLLPMNYSEGDEREPDKRDLKTGTSLATQHQQQQLPVPEGEGHGRENGDGDVRGFI